MIERVTLCFTIAMAACGPAAAPGPDAEVESPDAEVQTFVDPESPPETDWLLERSDDPERRIHDGTVFMSIPDEPASEGYPAEGGLPAWRSGQQTPPSQLEPAPLPRSEPSAFPAEKPTAGASR